MAKSPTNRSSALIATGPSFLDAVAAVLTRVGQTLPHTAGNGLRSMISPGDLVGLIMRPAVSLGLGDVVSQPRISAPLGQCRRTEAF